MTSQDLSQRMKGTSPAQRLRLQAVAAEFLERMGARIRARRDELELSRSDVARRMPGKVSENQLYRWENGLHQPNPDTLEALASALETKVVAFMTDAPDKEVTPTPFDDAPRSAEARLDDIESRLDRLQALIERSVGEDVVADVEKALGRSTTSTQAAIDATRGVKEVAVVLAETVSPTKPSGKSARDATDAKREARQSRSARSRSTE